MLLCSANEQRKSKVALVSTKRVAGDQAVRSPIRCPDFLFVAAIKEQIFAVLRQGICSLQLDY